MASLQCADLRGDPRVFSAHTTLTPYGSSECSRPIQTNFCHSMPDPDLPASMATTPFSVPSGSSGIQWRSETNHSFTNDAEYYEGEASKDFWSEFSSVTAMDQRGVEEINQEVDDDQMGRPVLNSRKRHKGLLGGITEFDPTA